MDARRVSRFARPDYVVHWTGKQIEGASRIAVRDEAI